MIRKLKKGFTIVELVIVIAVIAVLTAVLIPTFVHLSNKAKLASDNSLVSNLNTALKMEYPSSKKPSTMHEAVKGLENQGYIVPQLVTKSNEELVYNLDENEFCLSSNATGPSYKYWKVCSSKPSEDKWSIYAFNWTGGSSVTDLTVGFDAGEESFTEIEYERAGSETDKRSVTIRSNGENPVLTVNAPFDTVDHYDYLDSLTVTAVDSASYHEHGTIRQKAVISKGHIEIEDGAVVPQVSVESASGAVKVTANESTIITVDSASASNTAVVSNSTGVVVDGLDAEAISGSQSSSVVYPTLIDTEAKLKTLFDNGGLAKLDADIALTQNNFSYVRTELAGGNTEQAALGTNKSVVLNLNGHTITGEALADDLNFIAVDNKGSLKIYDDAATKGRIVANAKMIYVRGSLEIINGEYVSTVLTAGTDFRSMFIADQYAQVTIRDGKFYTPKCVITSWGSVTVDNGDFICCSASTGWSSAKGQSSFAYTMRLMDGVNYVNGGNFYGLHGALSCEGGKSIIANVYSEASEETLAKFGEYTEAKGIKIHVLDKRAEEFLVDSDFVAAKKASFKSSVHYGLYVCGEYNIVRATVNSGTFKSSDKNAAYIGNNNDGGKGLYAHTTINGGLFVGATNKAAVHETGIVVSYGAGYTEIFGGEFSTDVSSLMKDTVNYQCVKQSDTSWIVSKR